jgi:sec-independent protein translocase protein TatB
MPGFEDSAVIVLLALLLFGPKKLPVLARQLGKLMGDFRRASNEFRTQMEEELRISEQADRQKQIAAIEAAAPPTAVADPIAEPESPQLALPEPDFASATESNSEHPQEHLIDSPTESTSGSADDPAPALPIATSGELTILPPSTGLPVSNSTPASTAEPNATAQEAELETETLHG